MAPGTQQQTLFQHYFSDQYSYDELLREDGNLRTHWQTFFQSFGNLGADEIANRGQDIQRFLKENGVTYNIYDDPSGFNRAWNLDPIPFIITKEEWQLIESGLMQRAELFNLILKDIYGERRLIKNGLLPMELIYNHTGFLRQCAGIKLPGRHNLVVYSADMARSPDGKIWILNDRTQAPSGSGYALENRMAMANILPELFDGFKVRRLSSYFNVFRNAMQELAPGRKQHPRVVMLTPGPGNETYFEHSYLSSYLGFTLAQGSDLVVKDGYLWLKTISGLEKVDVLVRRVDDVYCDPLELKEDSQLGIPGLLQVVRNGNVGIANPLGSSILENPGLMPFLQHIATYLLGESLIMPTIASWWCGQPKEMQYVLEHLPELVVKRIYRDSTASTSYDPEKLSTAQLQALKEQIKAHPYLYVGQEKVNFSFTPSLVNGKVEPRNALFRSFAISNGNHYTIMAGGLTRTAAEAGNVIISNQSGGISKDTWVISPEPGAYNIHKELASAAAPSMNSGILTSHTAENLFWVGRYAERILGNARFQRTVMQELTQGNRVHTDNDITTIDCLLQALTQYTYTYPDLTTGTTQQKQQPWKEMRDLLFDVNRPGTLGYNFLAFNRAVHAVRDHWSTDTWRVVREMEELITAANVSQSAHLRMLHVLDNLITSMVAFIGLNRESISREQGWIMLDTGRKLEQSLLLVNLLQATLIQRYDEQVEYSLQDAVLKSNECLVNYRYKYRAHLQLPLLLDLMLLDSNNPRSLLYQLERIKAYLAKLPQIKTDSALAEQERLVLEAYTMLKLADKDKLSVTDSYTSTNEALNKFLTDMQILLSATSTAISKTYFTHVQTQKQLFIAGNE